MTEPLIERGTGWIKVHYRRDVTDRDHERIIAAAHTGTPAQGALLWRVPRLVGDALSLSRWNYFDREEDAGCEAQALGTDYEEVRIVCEAAQPLSAVAQPAPKYDLRAFARFLYEHCALDPDKAGDVAATILSEYTVWPDDSAAQPPAAPVDLTDPVVVHANMLRGTIAKPTWEQIKHLYPEHFQSSAAIAKVKSALSLTRPERETPRTEQSGSREATDEIIEDMIIAWDIAKEYRESFKLDCERLLSLSPRAHGETGK